MFGGITFVKRCILADGRRVQVKDIEVLPGEIRMQLETSPTKN
jgi:hypothetical protein